MEWTNFFDDCFETDDSCLAAFLVCQGLEPSIGEGVVYWWEGGFRFPAPEAVYRFASCEQLETTVLRYLSGEATVDSGPLVRIQKELELRADNYMLEHY